MEHISEAGVDEAVVPGAATAVMGHSGGTRLVHHPVDGVGEARRGLRGRTSRHPDRRATEELVIFLVLVAGSIGTAIMVATVGAVAGLSPGITHPLPWVIMAMQLAVTPAIFYRRRAPVAVAVVVAVAATVQLVPMLLVPDELSRLYLSVNAWTPLAVQQVVDNMVDRSDRGRTRIAWVAIGVLAVLYLRPWAPAWDVATNALLHVAVPALLGLYLAARRRLVRELTDRAERAEREQHWLAERARAEERARLAAEMHDVVAHRATLMVLQAGALRMTAPDAATREAAEALRVTGCQALEELRDLLAVLRTPASNADDDGIVPATDTGGPPDLAGLAADSRSVGIVIDLVEDGDGAVLSPVVSRTAYRIAREALTNVRKHAPGARVRVHARYGGDEVRLTIRNTVPATRPTPDLTGTGSGTGLAGLRQRVELVGGELRAGPCPDGGYELDARMPAYVLAAEHRPEMLT
jgi:signal transduction histidine kinase